MVFNFLVLLVQMAGVLPFSVYVYNAGVEFVLRGAVIFNSYKRDQIKPFLFRVFKYVMP